jgi:two-component system, LytTR family, response regulator
MIRCIAVDDEPLALEVLRKYALETPALNLLGAFTDAFLAGSFLKVNHVDCLFVDIQMPDINGIRFIESLKCRPLIVFTTAFSEYAVKGFELEAVDYLVKPIRFDRFLQTVDRVKKTIDRQGFHAPTEGDFIFVKSEYQSIRIFCDDIVYIEGLDDYVKIYLHGASRPILSLISLKGIMEKLPEGRFMRVHRSYIVPVRLVRSIHNRQISLGDHTIPIGETYYKAVQDWLGKH